jgi:non-heme chloroperoxidase
MDARGSPLTQRAHTHHAIQSHHVHALAHAVPVNPTGPAPGGIHGSSYFDPNSLPDPSPTSSGSVFITNDGVRLYYEEKGSGHPLILIHGWSGSSKVFVRNFDILATSFRVIRFDLRGHGDSETPGQGFHVARFAVDLLNLLDHLQLERVALLGCSLGCAVIWSYVELFGSQRISAAMFIDQSPWQLYADDGSWRLGSEGLFSTSALAHLSASLTYDPRGCHSRTVRACLTRSPTAEEEEFFVAEGLKAQGWFLAKLMADHNNNDWRATLQYVTCPALVIAGKQSKIFPWAGVAFAAEAMPNAKLITFDEGSHWLYYEEADRFNSVVTAFLQSIVSATT